VALGAISEVIPASLALPAPDGIVYHLAALFRSVPREMKGRSTSAVRRAVVAYSEGTVVSSNGSCQARLAFPPDFVGFQGHFPDNPVLPGVCLIEAVLGVLETAQGTMLRLRRVASAKFREPVKPGQLLEIDCASSAEDRGLKVRAQISSAGARVAEIVLHVTPS
jgi:3-hydroxyacyl-[acyl-carrier-protein] dehydratase